MKSLEKYFQERITKEINSAYKIEFKEWYPASMVRMQYFHIIKDKHQSLHLFNFLISNLGRLDRFIAYLLYLTFLRRSFKISNFISNLTLFSKRVKIIPVTSGMFHIEDRSDKDLGKTIRIDFILPLTGCMKEGVFGDLKYKGKIHDIKMPVWNNEMENEIIGYIDQMDEMKNPIRDLGFN